MPGLVGIIGNLPRPVAERRLRSMLGSMCHGRGYLSGLWIDETLGVYVGWTALPLDVASGSPIWNLRGDACVIVSGEDFSAAERSARLGGISGTSAVSTSAGPDLVRLFEDDPSFPEAMNGRFHGLAMDTRRRTCVLFNDRYGMHRLYYHQANDGFYFAAEAKSLLAVFPELRSLDPRALGEFVSCGCTLENRTLFQGVHVLPPASKWTFAAGLLQIQAAYFKPETWEAQDTLDPETYYKELRSVFTSCLPRYFGGNQKVAVSLTGGLDTRMIMAWHKAPPGTLPCYSFGGTYRDCKDVIVGAQVARACRQPHEVIHVGQEFLARFGDYAERTVYLTDGCVEVRHAADLYANEVAARIAPVRLTGNYGGEVLRHVRAFKPGDPAPGMFALDVLPYMQGAGTTYRALAECHPLSFAVFRQAPWHHYGLLSLEQTQVVLRSPYLDNELVRTVFRAPASVLTNSDLSLRLISDGDPALGRIPTDRGLAFGDKRISTRARNSWIEFTVKAEYAYDYGMPQWMAKTDRLLLPLHLERLFLGRHKFCHFRIWYRDSLRHYLQEILLDQRTLSRPFFRRTAIEAMVREHLRGARNCTLAIHKALTLELIHRLLIDPVSPPGLSTLDHGSDDEHARPAMCT